MIPGFVKMGRERFSAEVWPRIKNKVDAMESNWLEGKKGVRPIIIKWGYKDASSGETVIFAMTRADDDGDEYWVDPLILPGDHGRVD